MNYTADEMIQKLDMKEHYEGGYYKFVWKSSVHLPKETLSSDYDGDRKAASVIYYLLKPGQTSTWHLLTSDELWFWHCGGTLKMTLGEGKERVEKETTVQYIGANLDKGESLQARVPAGAWQTTTPTGDDFVLVSCVVSPGFEIEDFYLPKE